MGNEQPVLAFTSHITGKNAKVEVYNDRIEIDRPGGLSAGKIAAGVFTGGLSLAVTGVGKKGYTRGAGRGRDVIPIRAVTSVNTRKDGPLNTIVAISSPSGVIDMRVAHKEAEQIRATLNQLIAAAHEQRQAPAVAAPEPTVDATEQLAKLASLRDSGVLTDDEFAAKKAEILARI